MLNLKSKTMNAENVQLEWQMNSRYHKFPSKMSSNAVIAALLEYLKEYDERCQIAKDKFLEPYREFDAECQEARAQMIKKIMELNFDKAE
jgi:hypothetical protein